MKRRNFFKTNFKNKNFYKNLKTTVKNKIIGKNQKTLKTQ
ncbi:hypothetical protein LEP1GSC049_2901 [Leptospira kirschneri serovar Cynopteri str. 3522 CT]|nr:hypothetical protein LEP1GSC064_0787 [Leptospira kirschneri serovar Grippotyphosa str. Moskva]EKR09239.1 hypothetical protein LEP1GSC122_0054 [Leptospira kirschneri serovar Valbuzzi str. 200702274]EPG50081.1 hypothetical protein LEP1GSC049_2901 [Leptospira kirschneri serovar Cynopteri str. 3522 CT]